MKQLKIELQFNTIEKNKFINIDLLEQLIKLIQSINFIDLIEYKNLIESIKLLDKIYCNSIFEQNQSILNFSNN